MSKHYLIEMPDDWEPKGKDCVFCYGVNECIILPGGPECDCPLAKAKVVIDWQPSVVHERWGGKLFKLWATEDK